MTSANLFPGVKVILVETSHPGNIGAAARAMKNMGLTELVLVKPLDFPNMKAVFRSASAGDVVRGAQVVETLEEAPTWQIFSMHYGVSYYLNVLT